MFLVDDWGLAPHALLGWLIHLAVQGLCMENHTAGDAPSIIIHDRFGAKFINKFGTHNAHGYAAWLPMKISK